MNKNKAEKRVVDASVLIHSTSLGDFQYLAPNSVILEIIDSRAKAIVESAIRNNRIRIEDPKEKAIEEVRKKARETGDLESLSDTDVEVIALALEKNAIVISDDYAIQNTASQLGLKIEVGVKDGIKKTIKWTSVCEGCGRTYEKKVGTCEICGSRIRKKPT
jgi:UPF0271 protein